MLGTLRCVHVDVCTSSSCLFLLVSHGNEPTHLWLICTLFCHICGLTSNNFFLCVEGKCSVQNILIMGILPAKSVVIKTYIKSNTDLCCKVIYYNRLHLSVSSRLRARGVLMVKINDQFKCILSILVYNLFYRQTAQYLFTNIGILAVFMNYFFPKILLYDVAK